MIAHNGVGAARVHPGADHADGAVVARALVRQVAEEDQLPPVGMAAPFVIAELRNETGECPRLPVDVADDIVPGGN